MVMSIPVIVLSGRQAARTDAFLRCWETSPGISLSTIPGVYLDQTQIKDDSRGAFFKLNGRYMTVQELGCAEAHFLAREAVAVTSHGGIIFEDDARFTEPQMLIRMATDFLEKHRGHASVLNLCESSLSTFQVNKPRRSVKLFGHAPLAVAYVLTPEAAAELNRANNPITWVADWPVSNVEHFVCVPALVQHGDENSGSEIAINLNGRDLRHKRDRLRKILNTVKSISLLSSATKRNRAKFLYFAIFAPLYWRIDLIKTRFGYTSK